MLKEGQQVKTNDDYFEKLGRRVYGTVVEFVSEPVLGVVQPEEVIIVRWDRQEGRAIKEHQGQNVIMLRTDLERVH